MKYWRIHWRNGGTAPVRRLRCVAGWVYRDWISEPRKGRAAVSRRIKRLRVALRAKAQQ